MRDNQMNDKEILSMLNIIQDKINKGFGNLHSESDNTSNQLADRMDKVLEKTERIEKNNKELKEELQALADRLEKRKPLV